MYSITIPSVIQIYLTIREDKQYTCWVRKIVHWIHAIWEAPWSPTIPFTHLDRTRLARLGLWGSMSHSLYCSLRSPRNSSAEFWDFLQLFNFQIAFEKLPGLDKGQNEDTRTRSPLAVVEVKWPGATPHSNHDSWIGNILSEPAATLRLTIAEQPLTPAYFEPWSGFRTLSSITTDVSDVMDCSSGFE